MKEIKTVMVGVLSSHAKVLALKVPKDLMDVWAVIGTGKKEDSEIARIEIPRNGRYGALIRFLGTRMLIMIRTGMGDGMESAEGGMSRHGLRMIPINHHYQEIGRVTETDTLTEPEAGEKRSVMTRPEIESGIVIEKRVMTVGIDDGTEIGARSVIQNGWMSQRMKRSKPIPRRISKNGKRG